jgi:hypothetical protein
MGSRRIIMAQLAAAIFDTREDAGRAVAALQDHGVNVDNISVLALADDGSGKVSDLDVSDRVKAPGKNGEISFTTPEDSAKGAGEGALIGAGIGILAAIASIFVPGFGFITGGGALASAIGGAVGTTVAGAVAGGVTGYLADMGVPAEAAQNYSEAIKKGGILVSVHDTDEVSLDEVRVIFDKYHGRDAGTYGNINLPAATSVSNPDALDATNARLRAADDRATLAGSNAPVNDIDAPMAIDADDEEELDAVTGTEGSASGRLNDRDVNR